LALKRFHPPFDVTARHLLADRVLGGLARDETRAEQRRFISKVAGSPPRNHTSVLQLHAVQVPAIDPSQQGISPALLFNSTG
jgi:hypothetical protein